jgi:hypothetical protein
MPFAEPDLLGEASKADLLPPGSVVLNQINGVSNLAEQRILLLGRKQFWFAPFTCPVACLFREWTAIEEEDICSPGQPSFTVGAAVYACRFDGVHKSASGVGVSRDNCRPSLLGSREDMRRHLLPYDGGRRLGAPFRYSTRLGALDVRVGGEDVEELSVAYIDGPKVFVQPLRGGDRIHHGARSEMAALKEISLSR